MFNRIHLSEACKIHLILFSNEDKPQNFQEKWLSLTWGSCFYFWTDHFLGKPRLWLCLLRVIISPVDAVGLAGLYNNYKLKSSQNQNQICTLLRLVGKSVQESWTTPWVNLPQHICINSEICCFINNVNMYNVLPFHVGIIAHGTTGGVSNHPHTEKWFNITSKNESGPGWWRKNK